MAGTRWAEGNLLITILLPEGLEQSGHVPADASGGPVLTLPGAGRSLSLLLTLFLVPGPGSPVRPTWATCLLLDTAPQASLEVRGTTSTSAPCLLVPGPPLGPAPWLRHLGIPAPPAALTGRGEPARSGCPAQSLGGRPSVPTSPFLALSHLPVPLQSDRSSCSG